VASRRSTVLAWSKAVAAMTCSLSIKQERLVHQLAAMTHTQVPVEIKTMGPKEADAWVRDASKLWRELGYPTV
jgi:hypothetical protein